MNAIFSLPVRVYYEDTDSGGVVYHSNYLNFMERARTEWLRALGFEQDELLRENGVLFAVSAVSITFHKPARFNELLAVTVTLARRREPHPEAGGTARRRTAGERRGAYRLSRRAAFCAGGDPGTSRRQRAGDLRRGSSARPRITDNKERM